MLETITLTLRLVVAGVLLASGIAKLRTGANEETWASLIGRAPGRLRSLPARPASWAHIGAELVVGALVLVGGTAGTLALGAATALFAGFALLALYAARSPEALPCSCFGRAATPLGLPHAWRNLGLTALSAAGLALTVVAGPASPSTSGAVALAVGAAFAVTVLVVAFDDLVDLFRPGAPAGGGAPGVHP